MSQSNSTARRARRFVVLSTALAALSFSRAQTPPVQMEQYVTTATRTPVRPQQLGSAVDVISAEELADRQISAVSAALGAISGAPLMQSGGPGSVASIFLRGANSNQILFLVDGIRMNDPNTDYQVFTGGASLGAHDRIEVARGPQSTLYGADAIGGVVSIAAERGEGPAKSSASVEAGSFSTVDAGIACSGAQGADAWNFSASGGHTDDDRPNNRFGSGNVALRLDRQVTTQVDAGATLRWFHSELGSPGDRFTNDINNHESEDNLLATTFVDAQFGNGWSAHAILGGQNRRYVNEMPAPNPPYDSPAETDVVTNRRGVIDAQTSFKSDHNRVTVGTTDEINQTRNTGFGDVNHSERLFAAFAEDEYSPIDTVWLTGGVRTDDFDTFGRATTGRATAAWQALPKTLKLRMSYGTGFRAPSFLELYGKDPYFVGNPNIQSERSRGGDVGLDYYPTPNSTLSATWFETKFNDLIDYDFSAFPSTVVNLGRARTRGVELAARLVLPEAAIASLSYTYLDAQSLEDGGHSALLRRPRHQLNADLHHTFAHGVTAGIGGQFVGRRADVDAASYATVTDGTFTVVRVYGAWQVTPRLALKARVENLLDRKYEAVNGYPALGLGAFGGVEYNF